MRRYLGILIAVALFLTALTGCGPRKQPGPGDYVDREPLPSFNIHLRATGGHQLHNIRYKEWTIKYEGHGEIHCVYLSENHLGHMDHREIRLPAWRGYALWDILETNDVWELYSDSGVTVQNRTTYNASVSLGGRSNSFQIYGPDVARDRRYNNVVKAIEGFF